MARSVKTCLLYTSDAADERSSVDLGGRRIIKKKTQTTVARDLINQTEQMKTYMQETDYSKEREQ